MRVIKQDTFSFNGWDIPATIAYHSEMTAAEFEDYEAWVMLHLRKCRRHVVSDIAETPEQEQQP